MTRSKTLLAVLGVTAMLGGASAAFADPAAIQSSPGAATMTPIANPAPPARPVVKVSMTHARKSSAMSKSGHRRLARAGHSVKHLAMARTHKPGVTKAKFSHRHAKAAKAAVRVG